MAKRSSSGPVDDMLGKVKPGTNNGKTVGSAEKTLGAEVAVTGEFSLPVFIPTWLAVFFANAAHENEVLQANGADQAAAARRTLLKQLAQRVTEWYETDVDVAAAAEITGVCRETIRRRIRSGKLDAEPKSGRGRHRIKRAQLVKLDQVGSKEYDPVADAQGIVQLRRQG